MKSEVHLEELHCYTHITEVEGVFDIKQDGNYVATVYGLAQFDENGRRGLTVTHYDDYSVLYKEEYGAECVDTKLLNGETIDMIQQKLEEEL